MVELQVDIRTLPGQTSDDVREIGGAYSVRKVLSVNGKPPPPYQPTPLPPRLPADERQPGDAPLVQPETSAPVQPERFPDDLPLDEPPPDAPF